MSLALQPDSAGLMLSINKMSEGYKITKIGGAKPPTPEPELRGSVASEMLSQEEVEGEIEQRVEELIELDEQVRFNSILIPFLVHFNSILIRHNPTYL